MRESTELRRIFHEAARDQPNYLASTDAGDVSEAIGLVNSANALANAARGEGEKP